MKTFTADMRKGRLMSDLISTQEAVVKIVDTAMRKIMSGEQKLTKEYEQSVKDAVNVILDTARCETIQCKDCRFHHPNNRCVRIGVYVDDGDCFCCWAERRTDE